jgi:hypothetical protein
MEMEMPPEEQGRCRPYRLCCIVLIFIFAVLVLSAIILLVMMASMNPRYYAAIDAISGLDLLATNNLSKPAALDRQVEFNLTLGVKARSAISRPGCFRPGAIVTVTYLGVQIADGSTGAQACATDWKPQQMVRIPVVARATLPAVGSVLKSLAADERRGLAVLDVSLRIPPRYLCDDEKLVVCTGRRVGGVVEESSAPCNVQTFTTGDQRRCCYGRRRCSVG